MPRLCLQEIASLLKEGGCLQRAYSHYEMRQAQLDMCQRVAEAYNTESIALIDAGTGIGKSMAYLLPAILNAYLHREKTVIATHTIPLQEQLLYKDIPLLTKALGIDLKVVLVKGMNNYLCLRKLHDASFESSLCESQQKQEIDAITKWSCQTASGSRSDLDFVPSSTTWERVGAEGESCGHASCPHFKNCFFFKARSQVESAHLLIVNHHVLCAHMVNQQETTNKEGGILPPFQRLVIDEAHHLEDVATEHLAIRISYLDVMHQLAKLSSDHKSGHAARLHVLKNQLLQTYPRQEDSDVLSILRRIDCEIPAEKIGLQKVLKSSFDSLVLFLEKEMRHKLSKEETDNQSHKLRLRPDILQNAYWIETIAPSLNHLMLAIKRYVQMLLHLDGDVQALKCETLQERIKGLRLDMQAVTQRLLKSCEALSAFLQQGESPHHVRWIEIKPQRGLFNVALVMANLEIAPQLSHHLFKPMATAVLCSATLATSGNFRFVRQRLGIDLEEGRTVQENIYPSPFDYKEQALFAVPTNMPNPSDRAYTAECVESIWNTLQACLGGAFVLFTSYQMMLACYDQLASRLKSRQFFSLMQGQMQRHALLQSFKTHPHAVLFGTDSFWEGVDVVGEALRCVIIVKLPFRVPSEPIVQARSEAIAQEGGDPFMDYTLPGAIVKFKQGVGRLIRNKRDRGCIVCLDPRIIKKGYGKLFMQSLPPVQCLYGEGEDFFARLQNFYHQFHVEPVSS